SASGIMINPSVPAKNLKEFIAYAKANAARVCSGSVGTGTMPRIAGELFKLKIGAPAIPHVPYRGAGPSIADLVAGQIQMATINVTGQLVELHRAGKIRILAVTAPERLKGVPDIPTAVEEGMPGMIAQLFTGLFLPAKTPKTIIDQVYEASQKVMTDPAMQQALIEQGLEPITNSSPDKVRAFIEEEVARWTPVVKAAGLKAEGWCERTAGVRAGFYSPFANRSSAWRCSATRSTLLVDASGSSSTNQTKRGCW